MMFTLRAGAGGAIFMAGFPTMSPNQAILFFKEQGRAVVPCLDSKDGSLWPKWARKQQLLLFFLARALGFQVFVPDIHRFLFRCAERHFCAMLNGSPCRTEHGPTLGLGFVFQLGLGQERNGESRGWCKCFPAST